MAYIVHRRPESSANVASGQVAESNGRTSLGKLTKRGRGRFRAELFPREHN